jgi:hypothetical protein
MIKCGYMNKKLKIEFIPANKNVEIYVDRPLSAKKFIPDWYKNTLVFNEKNVFFDEKNNEITNLGLKKCMPFIDSLTCGYIQSTWCDIYINCSDDKIEIRSSTGPKIIIAREKNNLEIPVFFHNIEFAWKNQWLPKLPDKYSILLTHPLNRYDLPFQTLSGIIDSDKFYHTPNGNFPFFLKKEFSGFIPAGTPMYQLIPFKRENWESSIISYSEKIEKEYGKSFKKFFGFYKNNFWNKKQYN